VPPLFLLEEADPEARLQFLYDRLAVRFGLHPARVRLSRRKLTGGEIAYGPPHRITISAHLGLHEQENTLRHEAAHAWAWRREGPATGHGALFRRLARLLGARPGPAPETEALRRFRRDGVRHRYRCETCGRTFSRFRPFRGARECLTCWREGKPSRLRKLPRAD
jgi:predicted SprT family Zn-dependent metalloprotease